MSVVGNVDSLKRLRATIATMSTRIRQEVARECAAEITKLLQASFSARRTAWDDARAAAHNPHKGSKAKRPGKGTAHDTRVPKGGAVGLVRSGATRGALAFTEVGTILRARLGTRYARYLIGWYSVLPMGRVMPFKWSERMREIVSSWIDREIEGAS